MISHAANSSVEYRRRLVRSPCAGGNSRRSAEPVEHVGGESYSFGRIETNEGLTFAPGTTEDFSHYLQSETARWRDVVKDAHIHVQ
jgi:hypothetical protein